MISALKYTRFLIKQMKVYRFGSYDNKEIQTKISFSSFEVLYSGKDLFCFFNSVHHWLNISSRTTFLYGRIQSGYCFMLNNMFV